MSTYSPASQPGRGYTAKWSRRARTVVITGPVGNVVASFPVTHEGDRPVPALLRDTEWAAYPGAEWEEDPPGEWTLHVFCFEQLRERREPR